jgi:uncharacterized protein (UPF0332 family)
MVFVDKHKIRLYLQRSENELRLAKAIFLLSGKENVKTELEANPNDTFYSAAIAHSYYSIFYCTKTLLLTKGIDTKAPEVHRKTYDLFKEDFIDSGELDLSLFEIYNEIVIRANELLNIFSDEKWKRGQFTYQTIAQANIGPAKESVENARKFIQHISEVIRKKIK